MKKSKMLLESKVNHYNNYEFSIVKLKLVNEVNSNISLYTEGNEIISSGTYWDIEKIIDALIKMRQLENTLDYGY